MNLVGNTVFVDNVVEVAQNWVTSEIFLEEVELYVGDLEKINKLI